MEWFSSNWVWVVFVVGMLGMHLFGHGHGGHGDSGGKDRRDGCGAGRGSKDADRKSSAGH